MARGWLSFVILSPAEKFNLWNRRCKGELLLHVTCYMLHVTCYILHSALCPVAHKHSKDSRPMHFVACLSMTPFQLAEVERAAVWRVMNYFCWPVYHPVLGADGRACSQCSHWQPASLDRITYTRIIFFHHCYPEASLTKTRTCLWKITCLFDFSFKCLCTLLWIFFPQMCYKFGLNWAEMIFVCAFIQIIAWKHSTFLTVDIVMIYCTIIHHLFWLSLNTLSTFNLEWFFSTTKSFEFSSIPLC